MAIHKVVVIDDDRDVGVLVEDVAASVGASCIVTSDAAGFLAALTPDITLIFLDLMMPGSDGIEILRQLAKRKCEAGIVMMSGVGKRVIESADALGQSLDLNMVGHLTKPFRVAELEVFLRRRVEPRRQLPFRPKKDVNFEEAELLRAVDRDEFVLHYQPQIELESGCIVGVKGLVRWEHPRLGLVFPDDFIEIAEDLGLIDALTSLVFGHGLSDVTLFQGDSGKPVTLSLNVSVSSLRDLTFPDRFLRLVEEHGCKPEDVVLEITESGIIRELSQTLDVLTRLRLKKVQLSIDDFGTGYSMMQQLRNVPATEMKIDKSIVQNLRSDNDLIILQKTIELGHELGMRVVAEGVETREQLELLRRRRCDVVQGYFFSRPVSSEKLVSWFEEYRSNAYFQPH